MHQMTAGRGWWARVRAYGWWWLFITALFLVPNLLTIPNIVPLYNFSWLDTLATVALAFNVVAFVVALAGAVLFAGLDAVTARSRWWLVRALPRLAIFTVFLVVWLRLLRGMLRVYKVEAVPVERPWERWLAVLLVVLLVILFRSKLAAWVDQATARVRAAGVVLLLLTLPLSLYLLLEPLMDGTAAPVSL